MASNESPNSESRGRMSHSAKRPIKRYSDVSSDGVRVRQMARFLTGGFEPAPRRFDTEITPAELAELHALHQSFVRSAPEVVDNRKTAFATGDDNSWMICPDIPNDSEGPFEPRDFTLSPLGTRPMKLLAKAGVAVSNNKGNKPKASGEDNSIGQDSLSVSFLGAWEAYGVFDGHGDMGHWPAQRAAQSMPKHLHDVDCAKLLRQGQVEAALRLAFQNTQADLQKMSGRENVNIQSTGSTATCVVRDPMVSELWVATVGDSRAALLVPGHGVVAETTDHRPTEEVERLRIEANGGEVRTTTYADGVEMHRIFALGKGYPGLCTTRTLGDLVSKSFGVTAEPDVVKWSYHEHREAYLLIACDGIWEFMETEQVGDFLLDVLSQGGTCDEALKMLVHCARDQWSENEGDYCDDITAILIPLFGNLPEIEAELVHDRECCTDCAVQ